MSEKDQIDANKQTWRFGIHPLFVRFRDRELEAEFRLAYVKQALTMVRVYMLLGVGAYIIYSLLDFVVLSEADRNTALLIRGIVCPAILVLTAMTFRWKTYDSLQIILIACMATAAGGIILMTAVIETPYSYIYYAGLILMILYASNILIFKFLYSTATSISLFFLYLYTASTINPIPEWALVSNAFFLFVVVAWTIWTSYWQDVYTRREFAQRYRLQEEVQRSGELLELAEAGNRAKGEFLAVISHELRTPLNAIIGFSEIIQQKLYGPIGSEKYASYIDDIAASGHHLLGIINDILDISKADAGRLELRDDEFDVVDTIDHTMRALRESASEKGLRTGFVKPKEEFILWADEKLIRQSITNILSNAIKFTPKGGQITVRLVQQSNGAVQIDIEDTGIGIEDGALATIVEPFVQVEQALSREHGGTGLGLPLVKKIVELHNGKLIIDSAVGRGTTVTIVLPPERNAILNPPDVDALEKKSA